MNCHGAKKVSLAKLGALNGFILGSLFQVLIVAWMFLFATYYFIKGFIVYLNRVSINEQSSNTCLLVGEVKVDYLPLLSLPIMFCLCVSLSCFLIEKFFAKRINSSLILWQVVGLISFLFFHFYAKTYSFITEFSRECLSPEWKNITCQNISLSSYLFPNFSDLPGLLLALAIILFFDLVFYLILRRKNLLLP